jgi:hypothetical protein
VDCVIEPEANADPVPTLDPLGDPVPAALPVRVLEARGLPLLLLQEELETEGDPVPLGVVAAVGVPLPLFELVVVTDELPELEPAAVAVRDATPDLETERDVDPE